MMVAKTDDWKQHDQIIDAVLQMIRAGVNFSHHFIIYKMLPIEFHTYRKKHEKDDAEEEFHDQRL